MSRPLVGHHHGTRTTLWLVHGAECGRRLLMPPLLPPLLLRLLGQPQPLVIIGPHQLDRLLFRTHHFPPPLRRTGLTCYDPDLAELEIWSSLHSR